MTLDDREQSRRLRRNIGLVAEAVQAAEGIIRLRDRTRDPLPAVWSKDLVWVEGNLRVDGNARLFGGKLDFRDGAGQNSNVPLAIDRSEDNGHGGRDLRLLIGYDEAGDNRLAAGPLIGSDFAARLVVRDDGNVGLGTESPEHNLQIGDAGMPVSLSLRGPDGDPASGVLAFEDEAGTAQHWFKFVHDTQAEQLKITSAEVDPILTIERTTGHVGIGTTDPDRQLHLKQAATHSANGLRIENAESTRNVLIAVGHNSAVIDAYSDAHLLLRTNGIGRLFIDNASGYVGIGTSGPAAKLEVSGGETILEQQSWQTPTLQSGWENYGSGYNPVGYFKDSLGIVHLRGVVENGTEETTIFTLPAAYRPAHRELHAVETYQNVNGRIDIKANGDVWVRTGSPDWISLDGITFRAA
jgi:hypothetical protein